MRKQLEIDRPIFMMGPGRSGSTLVHKLVTIHRDLAFFSTWSHKFPAHPWLGVGGNLRRIRFVERLAGDKRGFPRPTEAYAIWKYCIPDFWNASSGPCRDDAAAEKLREYIRITLRAMRAPRFITKTTGPPIFDFLASIFPDAKFIWIDRDPRAVSFSFYELGWLEISAERKATMSDEDRIAAAAKRYLGFYRAARRAAQPHLWVKYESFVEAPEQEMQRLLDFAELRRDPYLDEYVRSAGVHQKSNEKWRQKLTASQQAVLGELLREPLAEQGYA
jgi:hypothetical protein